MTTIEEVLSHCVPIWHYFVLPKPCLEWQEGTDKGYGRCNFNGNKPYVHQLIYEAQVGSIPSGYEFHHICRNRRCCETSHLQVVTHEEHMRIEKTGEFKSHCHRGHPYDEENTRWHAGKKRCHQCQLEDCQRYRAENPEWQRETERRYRAENQELINERQRQRRANQPLTDEDRARVNADQRRCYAERKAKKAE